MEYVIRNFLLLSIGFAHIDILPYRLKFTFQNRVNKWCYIIMISILI